MTGPSCNPFYGAHSSVGRPLLHRKPLARDHHTSDHPKIYRMAIGEYQGLDLHHRPLQFWRLSFWQLGTTLESEDAYPSSIECLPILRKSQTKLRMRLAITPVKTIVHRALGYDET